MKPSISSKKYHYLYTQNVSHKIACRQKLVYLQVEQLEETALQLEFWLDYVSVRYFFHFHIVLQVHMHNLLFSYSSRLFYKSDLMPAMRLRCAQVASVGSHEQYLSLKICSCKASVLVVPSWTTRRDLSRIIITWNSPCEAIGPIGSCRLQ